MKRKKLLQLVKDQKVEPSEAYALLYHNTNYARCRFCKLSITVKDESYGVNLLLKTLFFLPLPVFIVKMIAKHIKEIKNQLSSDEINYLFDMLGGSRIRIITADQQTKVSIMFL